MIFNDFGMDTASLAGSLEASSRAVRAGRLLAGDDLGERRRRASGRRRRRRSRGARQRPRVTGLEALRDFEGLAGQHARVQGRRRQVDARGLRRDSAAACCWSRRRRRRTPTPTPTRSSATCACSRSSPMPLGIRIAFKGVSWSRTVKDFAAAGRHRVSRQLPEPRASPSTRST